jgi:hypothetical protein
MMSLMLTIVTVIPDITSHVTPTRASVICIPNDWEEIGLASYTKLFRDTRGRNHSWKNLIALSVRHCYGN